MGRSRAADTTSASCQACSASTSPAQTRIRTCAQDLAERDHRLEILGGPLAGIYDPQGAGDARGRKCLRT
ncbi:hypothetical protein OHA63_00135 [Streptomyces anulatus]|uniref:hypothetical protein n=1 Tax=Streptomyces anulatus TaxID=1892 RepID=UPI002E351D70|nr:hypothetical protein [Streptomyces anulatus]